MSGEKSGLWREFARIVGELSPFFVVVENVGGDTRKWLPAVRRDLHVFGYETAAIKILASDVGAPHERARIFVLARHTDPNRNPVVSEHAEASGVRRPARRLPGWTQRPPLRMADGVSGELDRIRALGNSVVPQCAEVIGRMLLEAA
jgi:DNA (cytosine-5)-methyltransferase 1